MKPKPAGKRTERLILYRPVNPPTRNADGQAIEAYTEVAKVWASIEWPLTGDAGAENVAGRQPQAQKKAIFKFPWSRSTRELDGTWRIRRKRTKQEFGVTFAANVDEADTEWQVNAVLADGPAGYPTVVLDANGDPTRDADGNLVLG